MELVDLIFLGATNVYPVTYGYNSKEAVENSVKKSIELWEETVKQSQEGKF